MAANPSMGGGHFRYVGQGRRLALAVVLVLFAVYVGTYYHASRRGMREAKQFNMCGFLYVPAEEVFARQDLSRHYAMAQIYAPLNWVDREVFGADGPARCILFGLSK